MTSARELNKRVFFLVTAHKRLSDLSRRSRNQYDKKAYMDRAVRCSTASLATKKIIKEHIIHDRNRM